MITLYSIQHILWHNINKQKAEVASSCFQCYPPVTILVLASQSKCVHRYFLPSLCHILIYPHDRIIIRHLWLNTGWITELDSNTSECTSFSPSAYVYHSVPRTTFNYISLHHWVWKCRAAAHRWQVTMHEKHSCCQGISVLTWHRRYQGLARCCPKVDSGTTKTCSLFFFWFCIS